MKLKRGYYDIFVKTCAENPSRIAVRHYNNGVYKNYTYSELYGVCEYITQSLQQLQCTLGLIGVISERNIVTPCVIAAAHKCCRTFMFLDPTQDIEVIANSVKLNVIIKIQVANIATSDLFGKKPDKTVSVYDLQIMFFNLEPQGNSNHPSEYSFIAMTSGSTGEPKHIQVPLQCIQPNIDDLTKLFNIVPQDIIYFSTPLTFDPSMIEILLAFMNGASLLIAPNKPDILFPDNGQHSVTFWQTTPSKFLQHSNEDIKNKILCANSTLKVLALGGEPFNGVKRLKELKDFNNKTKIFTLYGVTEMSCWACAAELDLYRMLADKEVPLGNCLSETQILIDHDSHENKDTGKIILVSKTRKCIILNKSTGNEEENSLKFVDTGDLGEVRNGNVYYRGRRDDVVKRFGYKINLQFIESTIMQCPRVKTCSCLWLPKPLLLVVYFSSETLCSQELSDFLKCKLDDKHWPDKIVKVDNMPMNHHGKVSKSIISKMHVSVINNVPKTLDSLKFSFLKELQEVMNKIFCYDEVKHKDFFALGGTSFLAVTMCNKLSLTCPQLGKFILPYLMSQKNSIDEIIQLSQKELHICIEDTESKGKIKRTLSHVEGRQKSPTHKKANINNDNNLVEFIELWSYDTGKCVDASPTLFQIGFKLYAIVGSHSGKIVVMDAMSGKLQGMITLNARVEASVFCYHEESGSTPYGVVGAYDGTIICFAIESCKEIWKININSMIKSKAVCCNGLLYIASYDGRIHCLDNMTGDLKDTIRVADLGISADLVVSKKQIVIAATLSGECAGVRAGGGVAWSARAAGPVFAAPALYHDDHYVVIADVSGEVHCRTVESGVKIWKYQGAKGNIFSSIYVKKVDTLRWQMVFGCHDNKVYCINVKNHQPSLHWTAQLTAPVYSTPCALNDKFILAASSNGKLCVIDFDNGNLLTEHSLPGETFSSPAVYGDYIFIGCRNDHLYSLRPCPGRRIRRECFRA